MCKKINNEERPNTYILSCLIDTCKNIKNNTDNKRYASKCEKCLNLEICENFMEEIQTLIIQHIKDELKEALNNLFDSGMFDV